MAEAIAAEGVDKLINRLREDGIKAGEQESARIIREAEAKAARMVADARKEADELRAATQQEINAQKEAAQGALRLAARDTLLALRERVRTAFEQYVQRLIVKSTQDPDFIRSLILVLAGEAVEKHVHDKEIYIYLSKAMLEGERGPDARRRGAEFIKTLATGVLREGITLVPSDAVHGGAKVQLVREQIELDLSDEAITELLIRHITPRFREILGGAE